MRRFGVFFTAVLMTALFAFPASADRGSWNNWHVHDGTSIPTVDATGLTHRGAVFFPAIFSVSTATYIATPSLWAYCTDATDKNLVGGDGGAKAAAGQCRNDLYIIHLQAVATGDPAPDGWTSLSPGATFLGYTVYYRLTPR
jgi:hypothetical protein